MVIDIGMNVGIASLAFAENAMVKEVHGFEPFLAPFLRAKQNFDLNPELSRKIKANNYGLSNKNEKLIVKSDDLSTIGTSIRGADEGRIETIEVRDASEELKDYVQVARARNLRIVCKIDCEGSEFAIIESLERSGMLRDIDAIIMERHKWWDRTKTVRDLIDPLTRAGFLTFDRTNPTSEIGGIIFAVRQLATPQSKQRS